MFLHCKVCRCTYLHCKERQQDLKGKNRSFEKLPSKISHGGWSYLLGRDGTQPPSLYGSFPILFPKDLISFEPPLAYKIRLHGSCEGRPRRASLCCWIEVWYWGKVEWFCLQRYLCECEVLWVCQIPFLKTNILTSRLWLHLYLFILLIQKCSPFPYLICVNIS